MPLRACDFKIFEFIYDTTYAERQSTYGGMDSELTGRQTTSRRNYFCIAPTEDFARVAYLRYHNSDTLISLEEIGTVGDIVYTQ